MDKSALSALMMNCLRKSHLKSILVMPVGNDRLPEARAHLWATSYRQTELFLYEWWYLSTMSRLSIKGLKRRPIAFGNGVRWVYASA